MKQNKEMVSCGGNRIEILKAVGRSRVVARYRKIMRDIRGKGMSSLCKYTIESYSCRREDNIKSNLKEDGFGGLVVSMLASGSRVRGFEPDRSRWIFSDVRKSSACLPSEGK
jgi:hypothetical protein